MRLRTPLMRYTSVVIGANSYTIEAVSGQQSGYSLTLKGGLDLPVTDGTPVYYSGPAANVSVEYLDISHDLHNTTGTIYTGTGWTITHNNIHDGYSDSRLRRRHLRWRPGHHRVQLPVQDGRLRRQPLRLQ